LWSDIVRASDKKVAGHFIGSIVYIDTGIYQVMGANAIEIIDGQQRLTTLSLLLLALTHELDGNGDGSAGAASKLIKDYLLQEDDEDPGVEARYKLLLTKSDRDTFMRLIDGREIDPSQAPRLVDNYNLFVDQLKRRRSVRILELDVPRSGHAISRDTSRPSAGRSRQCPGGWILRWSPLTTSNGRTAWSRLPTAPKNLQVRWVKAADVLVNLRLERGRELP